MVVGEIQGKSLSISSRAERLYDRANNLGFTAAMCGFQDPSQASPGCVPDYSRVRSGGEQISEDCYEFVIEWAHQQCLARMRLRALEPGAALVKLLRTVLELDCDTIAPEFPSVRPSVLQAVASCPERGFVGAQTDSEDLCSAAIYS